MGNTDTSRKQKKLFFIFLVIWTLLNGLHASLAELANDEAYYWVYGQYLDWGYFDHPPAIALWTKAGYLLFNSEFGVRLLSVISSTATFYLLWLLVKPKDTRIFILLLTSMFIVHVGGFFAAPDVPLVLFVTAYLLILKRYLHTDSWLIAGFIGVLSAAMFYAKYHAVLIILFSLLPNLKLLRRPSFWLAAVVGLLVFMPHLIWQIDHDFVTFRYHLFERSINPYQWNFTTDFILGQFLMYGPLVGLLIPFAMKQSRLEGSFGNSVKWIVLGTFVFFLLNSFRGRIEANWTIGAFPPMVFWIYSAFEEGTLKKWLKRLAIPALIFIFLFRVSTIWEFLPRDLGGRNEFHGWQTWAEEIKKIAEDRVVVFRNNYRFPSKYMFYTGGQATSVNDEEYKGNQFDYLWEYSAQLQEQDAIFVAHKFEPYLQYHGDTVSIEAHPYLFFEVDNFRSFNSLKMLVQNSPEAVKAGNTFKLIVDVMNPTQEIVTFPDGDQLEYYIVYRQSTGFVSKRLIGDVQMHKILPGEQKNLEFDVPSPEIPGFYFYRIGINWNCIGGKNSFQYTLKVE